jgi:hypothetical protein
MIRLSLMAPSKETENKLRWETFVNDVRFKLYVPKWRVPLPWPMSVRVRVASLEDGKSSRPTAGQSSEDIESPIVVIVDRESDHSETVRFRPRGDQEDWQIGEPYIPYDLLPESSSQSLLIQVDWDRSKGTWSD